MSTPEASAAPPPPAPTGLTMPPARALAYMLASVTLAMTQQIGANLVNTNVYQIQGELGATIAETNWLIAAYMAPNVSLSIALIKIRMQYGLRNFAEMSLAGFVLAAFLNLVFVHDLPSAVVVRFMLVPFVDATRGHALVVWATLPWPISFPGAGMISRRRRRRPLTPGDTMTRWTSASTPSATSASRHTRIAPPAVWA